MWTPQRRWRVMSAYWTADTDQQYIVRHDGTECIAVHFTRWRAAARVRRSFRWEDKRLRLVDDLNARLGFRPPMRMRTYYVERA